MPFSDPSQAGQEVGSGWREWLFDDPLSFLLILIRKTISFCHPDPTEKAHPGRISKWYGFAITGICLETPGGGAPFCLTSSATSLQDAPLFACKADIFPAIGEVYPVSTGESTFAGRATGQGSGWKDILPLPQILPGSVRLAGSEWRGRFYPYADIRGKARDDKKQNLHQPGKEQDQNDKAYKK